MELLDVVPAEAMALRLYSHPAAANNVASLFAWLVAALAAAAGLWRIRAVSSPNKPGAGARSSLVDVVKQQELPLPSPAVDERRPRPARAELSEPASPFSEQSSPSKVRFTAYYGGAIAGGGDDGVVDGTKKCADRDEDDDVGVPVHASEIVPKRTASMRIRSRTPSTAASSWEEREMAVRRKGDLGWYRHLDMAVLDGSVVRLWDGDVTSPRARPRRAGLELRLSL